MKSKVAYTDARDKKFLRAASATLGLLLVPLLAMQFTDEVVWSVDDFIIAGVLLFGAALTYEFIVKTHSSKSRTMLTILLVVIFLLVWAELAVGVFGTPFAGS